MFARCPGKIVCIHTHIRLARLADAAAYFELNRTQAAFWFKGLGGVQGVGGGEYERLKQRGHERIDHHESARLAHN